MKRHYLYGTTCRIMCFYKNPPRDIWLYSVFTTMSATYSTIVQNQFGNVLDKPKNSAEALRRWGCTDDDILIIFSRRPSLRNMDSASLQSKLTLLSSLGIQSADLVRIIYCRPRFLNCRINNCFDERLQYFTRLFGAKEVLVKAIVRNPSLLTYDFHKMIRPAIALYEDMGIKRSDLVSMLLSRPTMIPRTSFSGEKREYISKTGVSKNSKMYKYVVTIIGVSRIATIREKVANLEKFGIPEEEIWQLFGRSPLLLTLSVDKVQRHMTFIVGTMKLSANTVTKYPFLLLTNLEAVLKPRMLLSGKIQHMGLSPQIKGPRLLRALRMAEDRFLKVFVLCHPKEIAAELMDLYAKAKGMKRLAEASKKNWQRGFPF